MTWDVDYDDGEEGVELCQKCVRPFVPYAVGEYIEVRMDEHSYAAGVIHAVHGGDESLFDVKLSTELTSVDSSKGDSIRTRIPTKDLRRRNPESRKKRIQTSKQTQLTVRTRVMSQVPGLDDDESYPGVITKVNPDGTFSVMFDDGDFVASVPRRMIAFEP